MPPAVVPRTWIRRFARLWGFAAFLIGILVLFRNVALPFIFAIVVAYVLTPVIERITKRPIAGQHIGRPVAIIVVYLGVITAVVAFLWLFVPRLTADFSNLFRESPRFFDKVNKVWVPKAASWAAKNFGDSEAPDGPVAHSVPNPTEHSRFLVVPRSGGELEVRLEGLELQVSEGRNGGWVIAPRVPKAPEPPGERWERQFRDAIGEAVQSGEEGVKDFLAIGRKIIGGTLGAIASFFLTLMVTAFILVDLERIHRFMRSLVPPEYQGDYDKIIEGIDRGFSGVIRGQLVICLVNGSLTYIGLLIFHVKYAILLAALAAVMSLIPIFGSILSSVPIVAMSLISTASSGPSITNGLLVLGWIVMIHLLEANFLNPKIMGTAAKIHPLVVVFALIAGERTYGLVGALFAVPVASILQTFFLHFRKRAWQTGAPGVAPDTGRQTQPP